MFNNTLIKAAGLALVAGVTLTAAACSSTPAEESTSQMDKVIAPIIEDVTSIDGKTVEVGLDNVVVVNADDVTGWTAEIADPSIIEFVPGTSEGESADALKTNPGFTPLKIGETKVTMTSASGDTVTFTIKVNPAMNG